MRIAQSNSAGIVIGSPQACFTWYCASDFFYSELFFCFEQKKNFFFFYFRDSREDLAGNVREVTGSTRGTP
jgi:hypothetical protein